MSLADAPPPVGPRGLAVRCAAQGATAYAAGASALACPYGPTRPFSRRAWVTGYNGAAQRAGGPLPGDDNTGEDTDEAAPWPGDTPTPR